MQNPTQQPLAATFANPPREFGVMPFWFWNDDLDEQELLRQIREFHAKGFGGFIAHARVGLSRRVGYLTNEFFRLMRVAVEEAARLDMKVVLYDEGSYPSGSAQGRVVAENPAYAARCLIALQHTVDGPARGYWRPNPGRAMQDRLVSVVLGREIGPEVLDPASLTLLPVEEPGLVRYEVPEGRWRLVACWEVFSGGTIRGVFDEEEEGHSLAPPAGHIMNPDAVACFLRHTHEQYWKHLRDHFGTTIVAMFTDEPSALGKSPRRGPKPKPFTTGFLDDLAPLWNEDPRLWLPALWLDCGPRTEEFRRVYDRAVHDRIERVFYTAQSEWCTQHGIALTGHPAQSNEMGALRHFQWPGQDMVWRWVTPGSPSALEGAHSVAPRAATSAAILGGRRRIASEALGAYGWRLTLDEAKWLLDWHLARGNNLFFLHACFYSIRGRRAFESEPDLGVHNVWWPHFSVLSDYLRRLCWLLTDGAEVCEVGVLTDPNNMAWSAAKELMQAQISFLYLDAHSVAAARVEDGRLAVGSQQFRAVVCDPPGLADEAARAVLSAFRGAGGSVLEEWQPGTLASQTSAVLGRDLHWPDAPDLRTLHYRKAGREFYLLVNEGEQLLEGEISLAALGALELWDPMDGSIRPWPGRRDGGRTRTSLRLERRQGLILAVDPSRPPAQDAPVPPTPGEVVAAVAGPWTATDAAGQPVDVPRPGDWAQLPDWETFSGTLRFSTEFELPPAQDRGSLFLDLGRVGDIAEVLINGRPAGVRAWAPYVLAIDHVCRPSINSLEVRVTNSMANAYDGLQMPSGLMGPVVLRTAQRNSR
jgi:hypothetical protein